ncbi:MAG: hypothetical protein RJA44_1334 [Pseudomonadota bacterium]
MDLPAVHLCIVQPPGQVHALGFIDQARYFRHQFRRMGAEVSLAKNRLRHDAVNLVFGAHLGFEPSLCERYSCIFVNLEQLGAGGAAVSGDYLELLRHSAVVDYHPDNLAAYGASADDVPIVSFGHAPYLNNASADGCAPAMLPLEQRPIDLLFIGSMNERRQALLQRIERSGRRVSLLSHPLYGPERDDLIRQAKAVVNVHFYATARFEQARAFQCLSLGTAFISERHAGAAIPPQFLDSVHWFDAAQPEDFFSRVFDTPAFYSASAEHQQRFAEHEIVGEYAEVLAFAAGYRAEHARQITARQPVWRPKRLHIGSGRDYQSGWLNVDISAAAQPDALLDLAQPLALPLQLDNPQIGPTELQAGSLELIYASNVLEHVADLPRMMSNCLQLLAEGGLMLIEVPYEHAPTAWQDPTHVRAFNEQSWLYYTDWFWYLGWFEHRFRITEQSYLGADMQPCDRAHAHFMRLTLGKCRTSDTERMTARTMQADFGGLPED